MQIGDPVKVTGTVKDMVTDKGTSHVSVLMQSDDLPGAPGREFWFPEEQVQPNPPAQPTAASETGAAHPAVAAKAAVAHPVAAAHSTTHT